MRSINSLIFLLVIALTASASPSRVKPSLRPPRSIQVVRDQMTPAGNGRLRHRITYADGRVIVFVVGGEITVL